MKIKTTKAHRANKKVQYTKEIGTVQFDENCEAEVTQEQFDALKLVDTSIIAATQVANVEKEKQVETKPDAPEPVKPEPEKTKETETEKPAEDEKTQVDADIPEVDDEHFDGEVDLNEFTVKELHEIAKEAGYPEDEWKKLKKQDLIEYLKNKM